MSVGTAVASLIRSPYSPSEPNLTFLLGLLMDEKLSPRHALDYPLSKLNEDLQSSGSGSRLEVSFDTHEHTGRFEGDVSYADLGVVVEYREHTGQTFRKAVLLQCKRLFPKRGEFRLESEYESFNPAQFNSFAERVKEKPGDRYVGFYLLYNPDADGLADPARKALAVHEGRYLRSHHPFFEYEHAFHSPLEASQAVKTQRAWLNAAPGLRAANLGYVEAAVERSPGSFPRLIDFYELPSDRGSHYGFDFHPFHVFAVRSLILCSAGTDDPRLISIAQGRPPDSPTKGPRLLARHTLNIRFSRPVSEAS